MNSREMNCSVCALMLSSKAELTKHRKMHDEGQEKKIRKVNEQTYHNCAICSKTFTRKSGLTKHTKNAHKNDVKVTEKPRIEEYDENDIEDIEDFIEDEEETSNSAWNPREVLDDLKQQIQMEIEAESESKEKPVACVRPMPQKEKVMTMREGDISREELEVLEMEERREVLEDHESVTTEAASDMVDNSDFDNMEHPADSEEQETHERQKEAIPTAQTNKKKYKCEACNSTFGSKSTLASHRQNACAQISILKDSCIKCQNCQKNFSTLFTLRRHKEKCIDTFLIKKEPMPSSFRHELQELQTEHLYLTQLARVARSPTLLRSLARRPLQPVIEEDVLQRVRGLQPEQVQALLARRARRMKVSLDLVIRICEGGREGRDREQVQQMTYKDSMGQCKGCKKKFQRRDSIKTHQSCCIQLSRNTLSKRCDSTTLSQPVPKKIKLEILKKEDALEVAKALHITEPLPPMQQPPAASQLGFRVSSVSKPPGSGSQVVTVLPCRPPGLSAGTLAACNRLSLLSPRLLQGNISVEKAVAETGLQEDVVLAWMTALSVCVRGAPARTNLHCKGLK